MAIVVDCVARSISFRNEKGPAIQVVFGGTRGDAGLRNFLLCYAIAVLQEHHSGHESGETTPTQWRGADDDFLLAFTKHMRWQVNSASPLPVSLSV